MPEQTKLGNGFLRPVRERKSERSPHLWGRIQLTPEEWNQLAAHISTTQPEQSEYGERYSLPISAWTKESPDGTRWVSFQISTPREQAPAAAAAPAADPFDGVPF